MSSIDTGPAAPAAPAAPGGPGGVSREQLVVFLADTLRGTAEERAPLVVAMSRPAGGAAVTCEQVVEVSGVQSQLLQCFYTSAFLIAVARLQSSCRT